ncbi:unnamed protein product [Effrenium voratum]|uniref:HECT-type E3 ubiquitin transferase n=1 Tax=Effrenium voratum TaxID=2562239 RepID=A0AA36N5C4_9DINO|nr:unnamed protein product [Effrenium voratum]
MEVFEASTPHIPGGQLLGTAALQDLSLQLFTETLALLTPGALLGAGDSMARLVPQLCSLEEGRRHMESLMLQLQWWPQYVQLVPLGFKAHFAAKQLKVNSDPNPRDPVQLEVQREQLLESLCAGLIECTDSLRWGIDVSFTEDEEESGDDKESPSCQRQEFFRLAAAEFMSPELGLFASKDGGRSFHVLPCDESRLAQLELCGKLIGLALLHQDQVPMRLSRPLRRRLLKAPLRPEDIASVDPEFYQKRVLYLLESQYQQEEEPKQLADLGLYFVDEAEAGQKLELCMGGAERPVTEENKMQYLDLLCHHRLLDSVQPQVAALERGMAALVPAEVQERLQRVLSPTELGLLLCGVNELNVEEWKASSRTAPGTSPEIWETFWRAVEAMTSEQQNALLEYATGSCHLPEGLRFTLAPSEGLVPEAVPCFQTLKLPSYASVEDMRSALLGACDR